MFEGSAFAVSVIFARDKIPITMIDDNCREEEEDG
jgi:hypothetical protein